MGRRVLKWPVPVDDRDHSIGSGPVVHVGTQYGDNTTVYVWTEETATSGVARRARVYGTGHPLPDDDQHLGSTVAGPFVWHVYAKRADL